MVTESVGCFCDGTDVDESDSVNFNVANSGLGVTFKTKAKFVYLLKQVKVQSDYSPTESSAKVNICFMIR